MSFEDIMIWKREEYLGSIYYGNSLEGFNTEDKKINVSLANEDGQNRLDEIFDKNKPVLVKITEKVIKNEMFFNKYLKGLEDNLKINPENRIYEINPKKIRVILIECFNTKGLTGAFDKSDNDNYERFFLGSTVSKSGSQLGRRQLGRHVYMLASKLRGFLALSVESKLKKEFLRGIQYLDRYEENGKKMLPYSSFCYRNKPQLPILDKEIIEEFKKITGIKRTKNDYGLSILIPEPLDEIKVEKIYKNYIRRFYPAIINGGLKIECGDKKVNSDNIDNVLEEERILSKKWVNFYREIYTRSDKDTHYISKVENYNYEKSIDIKDFSEDQINKIKKDYFAGKPVVLKFFVKIPFEKKDKKKEIEGFFNIALQKIGSQEKDAKPLFLRGNLQIPNEAKYFKYSKSCHAALWTDDPDLCELLGDSEGMAHDSWNMNHPAIQNSYHQKVKNVFYFIKSSLSGIFVFITDKKDEVDFETFADDLPTLEEKSEEEEKLKRDIIVDDEEEIIDPPPPQPPLPPSQKKMVKELKVKNGFRVIKTEECEDKNFPMKVRVRFAYRARNKNSFSCYNPKLHFDLTKEKGAKITNKKHIEKLLTIGNGVDFVATKPDFEIDITEFADLQKKDLDVMARKLKG